VSRDEAGFAELDRWLHARSPRLIVLEATGGLETSVAAALVEAHLLTRSSIPARRGISPKPWVSAKTDALDALVLLARFGTRSSRASPLEGPGDPSAGGLLQRRRQVVEMLTAEKNRLASAHPECRRISRRPLTGSKRV